ncbi:MAG: 1-acyl-sn-glycerol-3-phosphate acyltransferase [Clostridia bacterium]|nr:1-acyl-sn-glycerol-3-phosphate acyltransferase [Clostridia bacterium]
MTERKTSVAYRVVRWLIWLFYPRTQVVGAEHLPDGPAIVVGNHAQMNGPIVAELYFPGPHWIWCEGEMMVLREVPAYAFRDFWSQKPKLSQPFYRVLSYLIAPLAVLLFNNAHTIGVRRDARIMATMRETVQRLQEGGRVIIFPERDEKHNHILYAFQDGFVDAARLYCHRTHRPLPFVPMYNAPRLKKTVLGEPVWFDPDAPIDGERKRVCDALAAAITDLAEALPDHTVVPYRNIPRRLYPRNRAGGTAS